MYNIISVGKTKIILLYSPTDAEHRGLVRNLPPLLLIVINL